MDDRELALKLFVVLTKAAKTAIDRAVKDMKSYGLAEKEFIVLELLYNKGRFPLQQIGEKILVTSGGVTYTIDKLEGKGYLKRVSCPEDRRVTYAEITAKGRELFDNIFPQHARGIQTMMKDLTTDEKQMAITLLKKIGCSALSKG